MDKCVLEKLALEFKDDILQPFDYLIDVIGFVGVYELSVAFGGSALYVPTTKRLFGVCIANQVIKEFDGGNYKILAKKYELCERTIRNIVNY